MRRDERVDQGEERDDENRVRYLGFDVPTYQTFFFAVSALIAGLNSTRYDD